MIATRLQAGGNDLPDQSERIDHLNRRLNPDNIELDPPAVRRANGITTVVFNPKPSVRLRGTSACLGAMHGQRPDWDTPGAEAPEGSYALFRSSHDRIELVADASASRTIWYTRMADAFVASTSQRAIVALLGEFELNASVLPWVLSSGSLGPEGGWDTRLASLRPAERVMVDRRTLSLRSSRAPASFVHRRGRHRQDYMDCLESTLEDACQRIELDPARWLLPLSGGVDSRGLLLLLKNRGPLNTITWGVGTAKDEPGNDARIARQVADSVGVPNRYFTTDSSDEPLERLIERFLTAGEGRVAKISAYADGFELWKTIRDEGWDGIIRGDEAFGSMRVRNTYEVRHSANLTLLSDYFDARELASFALPAQDLPDALARQDTESLATWRDRLYQESRLPTLLAALTDLKTPYVEVMNPLLSQSVLDLTRALPDSLRTRKRLWRDFVESRSHGIPFAQRPALQKLSEFLSDKDMLELMHAELNSAHNSDLFDGPLMTRIRGDLELALRSGAACLRRPTLRSRLSATLSGSFRAYAARFVTQRPSLHPLVFAFRAFLVARMNRKLREDAAALRSVRTDEIIL